MTASAMPAPPGRGPSPRVLVARAALDGALEVEGIASGAGGPLRQWTTRDGTEGLAGVVAAAGADGTIDVSLHLVVRWPAPPLERLAASVRAAVDESVAERDLAVRLGAVDVTFADLEGPEPS